MKRVAIVQSSYIPWKGYFDLVGAVDEFILYDDAQYTRRDWRNRNRIKTPRGLEWLTVPVKAKGHYHDPIRAIRIDGTRWAVEHWRSLEVNYARAAHFEAVAGRFAPLYLEREFAFLSELNAAFIGSICDFLSIPTTITASSAYRVDGGRSERLAALCEQAGATEYVSGPSARDYLDEGLFAERKVKVRWFDYEGYPEYPQLWGAFAHEVSVLDLLFNCGPASRDYMKLGRA